MARCRCQGGDCGCVLTAGTNVAVTGTGTLAVPWVVSSTAGTIEVVDTPSLNLTGTPGTPYTIRGEVNLAPLLQVLDSAEIDLALTGAGTVASPFVVSASLLKITTQPVAPVGSVLALNAAGVYAPAPPVVSAPGLINTGVGIIGDGSVAAPLRSDLCSYQDLKSMCATP